MADIVRDIALANAITKRLLGKLYGNPDNDWAQTAQVVGTREMVREEITEFGDESTNKAITNLEMIAAGKDTVTGCALTWEDIKRLAADALAALRGQA